MIPDFMVKDLSLKGRDCPAPIVSNPQPHHKQKPQRVCSAALRLCGSAALGFFVMLCGPAALRPAAFLFIMLNPLGLGPGAEAQAA
tara:strand:+ start:711 stop:968 length:258 start_codon:yes stop_codon:yes gene_type:complete